MTLEAIARIIEPVEALMINPGTLMERDSLYQRNRTAIPMGGLNMVQEELSYDIQRLQQTTLGMIYEHVLTHADSEYSPQLLKTVANRKETETLDNLNHQLPKYKHLKTVIIDDNQVLFRFLQPLDLERLTKIIQQPSKG